MPGPLSTFPAEAVGLNGKKGREIQAGQAGQHDQGTTLQGFHQDGACLSYLLSQCRLSSPLLFTSHMLPSIKPPSPESSVGKESTCSAGDPGSVPGPGRSAGEGTGHPLQYSCTSLVAQLVKNLTAMRETWFDPWVGMIPWRRERLYSLQYSGLELCSSWGHKEWDTTEQLSLSLFQ